jgi:isocitrate lyase
MLAYVRLVQAREKELGVDVLTHQKWSGAPYMDGIMGAIQSGSSSSKSMGEGNTEKGRSLCIDFNTNSIANNTSQVSNSD